MHSILCNSTSPKDDTAKSDILTLTDVRLKLIMDVKVQNILFFYASISIDVVDEFYEGTWQDMTEIDMKLLNFLIAHLVTYLLSINWD